MQPLKLTGRTFYALAMAGLGFLCIVYKDFIIGRSPATPWIAALNPALGYAGGAIVILASVAIIARRNISLAALIIAMLILVLSLPRHLSQFSTDWLNGFKAMALLGGSLIIAKTFASQKNSRQWHWMIITGSALLASFFIAGGYAHFKFAPFVYDFIPSYIPFHPFFTYFCGVCLFAGGVGILIPATRKWAALLSGIMLTGWFLLLHIPRFIADTENRSDRMGLCESLAFAGIFFCLASISRKQFEDLKI